MSDQINWSMWEALGTILASSLALFFWLWAERIRPWLESPKLVLEIEEGSPFLASDCAPPDSNPPVGSWLYWGDTIRFRLCNSKRNRGIAYNVQVRAMGVYDERGVLVNGFDPTTLTWSATQTPGYYPLLNPSDYEYLDLLWMPRDGSPRLKVKNSETYLEPGRQHYIKVMVYAENASPQARIVQVFFDSTNDPRHPEGDSTLPYYTVQLVKHISESRGS